MKRLAVLGSTGSIGRQTLDIARNHPGRFAVTGLAAGNNWQELASQICEFRPAVVSVGTEEAAANLRELLGDDAPDILTGTDGLDAVATESDADTIVSALTGGVGLVPTLKAIRAGRDIALANKEVLVIAGEIISREAAEHGVSLLPVDSEISAIWQCLQGSSRPAKILLTASGGACRNLTEEEMRELPPEKALVHPTWEMGAKVTIDSATLMNKGFEVMEVRWMFDVPWDRIEVLVHHQSIIHSLVEFEDGSVLAQMGVPDMRLPIQYALTYPERMASTSDRLDLAALGSLTFGRPDTERFPALRLAREAGDAGGTMPAVLSGADEVAVEAYLDHRIGFLDIARVVEETMARHETIGSPSLDDCLRAEKHGREIASEIVASLRS